MTWLNILRHTSKIQQTCNYNKSHWSVVSNNLSRLLSLQEPGLSFGGAVPTQENCIKYSMTALQKSLGKKNQLRECSCFQLKFTFGVESGPDPAKIINNWWWPCLLGIFITLSQCKIPWLYKWVKYKIYLYIKLLNYYVFQGMQKRKQ